MRVERDDGGVVFVCEVRHYGPGEHPWEGGEGRGGGGGGGTRGCDGEIDGGELASGGTPGRCDLWRCGDSRDTLAWEYLYKGVPGGDWSCHKFSKVPGKYIVIDVDVEQGAVHGTYGYVNERLTGRIPAMEAHFSFTARTTSGYRCPVGNSRIPNSHPNSHHIHGGGYDFVVDGERWTVELKDSIIKWAKANGGVGKRYANKNHVHLAWN